MLNSYSAQDTSTRRIFVAEDNAADVYLIREAIFSQPQDTGSVELVVVSDGEQALEYLLRRGQHYNAPRPDLIVLDLNLPKVDGAEVLRKIRQVETLSGIPVIVFTSSDSATDHKLIRTLGAAKYITKPSDLDGFLAVGGTLLSYFEEGSPAR